MLVLATLLLLASPHDARAGGFGISIESGSPDTARTQAIQTIPFHPYKVDPLVSREAGFVVNRLSLTNAADEAAAARSKPWFVLLGAAEAGGALTSQPAPRPEAPPVSFALQQSQPNPFRREVTIRFDLPRESAVRLTVHDLQGRLVTTLASGMHPAGRHAVSWNRRSANGDEVPPGVYLYRIEAGPWRAQKKMVALP